MTSNHSDFKLFLFSVYSFSTKKASVGCWWWLWWWAGGGGVASVGACCGGGRRGGGQRGGGCICIEGMIFFLGHLQNILSSLITCHKFLLSVYDTFNDL